VSDILFHPEAEAEFASAISWYRLRSPRTADRFVAEIDRVLRLIESSPQMFPEYDSEHRFAVLRRFPYSIVYQAQPGRNLVIAVAHSSRASGYWHGRK
jgi:plasmid stabilization system protein ParE